MHSTKKENRRISKLQYWVLCLWSYSYFLLWNFPTNLKKKINYKIIFTLNMSSSSGSYKSVFSCNPPDVPADPVSSKLSTTRTVKLARAVPAGFCAEQKNPPSSSGRIDNTINSDISWKKKKNMWFSKYLYFSVEIQKTPPIL